MPSSVPPLSPNDQPFQRASFASQLMDLPAVHIRRRHAHGAYFARRNPDGWQHDLGAQDVFLDNLGIAVAEQLADRARNAAYMQAVEFALQRWQFAQRLVLPDEPWWGRNFNSTHRRAATGEPRSLLRLMPEDLATLSREEVGMLLHGRDLTVSEEWLLDPEGPRLFVDNVYLNLQRWMPDQRSIVDGQPDGEGVEGSWRSVVWPRLFEEYATQGDLFSASRTSPVVGTFGAILPSDMRKPLRELRILHPRHCTPDLPPRVGVSEEDLDLYNRVLARRDQGLLGTCVAHSVCFGLEVALQRSSDEHAGYRFSPAHLHALTGPLNAGRHLRDVVAVFERTVPCSEDWLPYTHLLAGRVDPGALPITDEYSSDVLVIAGLPLVRRVDVHDIAQIKALLAAGWVVVVTTRVTRGVRGQLGDSFIGNHGLLMAPLPGDVGEEAHAWCLVGYDHVDGATNWKYQGRFVALNSWGTSFAPAAPHGPGTLTLPFAFLLTEGIEAYAIRFV